MKTYLVVSRVEYVYEIEAESPEYAAEIVESGDGGQGNSVDAWVEKVTLPDDRGDYDSMADDVRQPGWCPTHRQSIRPGSSCISCLLRKPAA